MTDAEIIAAIEKNGAAFLRAMGRAGGGEERADTVCWTIGGSPIDYNNAVFAASLEPAEADAAIVASREMLRFHGVPGTWHVGPSMRPTDLRNRLLAHGFTHAGDDVGMAAELTALPELPVPGLAIEEVLGPPGLASWVATLAQGFGEGPPEAGWVGEVYSWLGYGGNSPWHHYLGRLDGRPVATATSFRTGDVAGVYFVFTLPEVRRRGIGASITAAALHRTLQEGARLGVLGASPMGEPVYRRMGFREYCRIGLYEWRPQ
ncbi:MAG TPA: GNAT family N-acetyltransferase [Devosiaceae bacterium]|jgi:GNAT superfamily N-acetyltransferase|nr:GNAT family N-acetyltransferase [Devosiaceae bacterium]